MILAILEHRILKSLLIINLAIWAGCMSRIRRNCNRLKILVHMIILNKHHAIQILINVLLLIYILLLLIQNQRSGAFLSATHILFKGTSI